MRREQALLVKQVLSQKPEHRGGKKAFEYFVRQKIVEVSKGNTKGADSRPHRDARLSGRG